MELEKAKTEIHPIERYNRPTSSFNSGTMANLKCQVHSACDHQGEEHQDQGGEAVVDGGVGKTWKSRERIEQEG